MKIFTEQPETPASTGNEAFDECAQKYLDAKMELFKWQLMWNLRSIESQINGENGQIIIRKDGEVDVIGFSDYLTFEIQKLI